MTRDVPDERLGRLQRGRRTPAHLRTAWLLCVVFGGLTFEAMAEERPACPDQAAALLPRVERLVSQFREESTTARVTPRIALAAAISRLRTIRRETVELAEWPEEICGLPLKERLLAAQDFEIQRWEAFLASSRPGGARRASELWAEVDRQLKALRELVEATRRR